MVEALRHYRNVGCESALDLISCGECQHEFLAGCPYVFGRCKDGPEVVTRMAKATLCHVAIEKVHMRTSEELKNAAWSGEVLPPPINVQRPGARYSSIWSRSNCSDGPATAAIAHAMLSRMLRLKSCRISVVRCSGRAAAAKAPIRSTVERVSAC